MGSCGHSLGRRRRFPTAQSQSLRIGQCGRWAVLIYVHKEQELDDVEQRYPAEHYVLVDNKLRILAAAKKFWGSRVTTIFVRQGHYATDPKILASYPPADISIELIGDLLQYRCRNC